MLGPRDARSQTAASIETMHPMSEAQFAAAAGTQTPGLEQVRANLYCLGLSQPGILPHYSFSYLLLDAAGAVHIIDTGWDSDENWLALTEALGAFEKTVTDVATVSVTHLHPDHLGMAARIREASGAQVAIHESEQAGILELSSPPERGVLLEKIVAWGVAADRETDVLDAFYRRSSWKPFTADRLLKGGERLSIPGHAVRVLHTPGHTTGHLAFVDEEAELVFLGDLLLPNQFPGIGLGGTPAGNPIDHYLASLDAVAELDDFEALPGHGYRFRGIAERCAETRAHHEKRTAEVAEAMQPAHSVWELASTLSWTVGWENLQGLALLSALAQTELHSARAQARSQQA